MNLQNFFYKKSCKSATTNNHNLIQNRKEIEMEEKELNGIVVPVEVDLEKLERVKKLLEEIKKLAQEVKDLIG